MQFKLNKSKPHLMHIDLNSCFATLTQQAYPRLRDKPLVIAAYATENAFILAPSIYTKKHGVKMGMLVREARAIIPNLIVRMPDPTLYRDAHTRFRRIFEQYTPDVTPKSIDEAILDFSCMQNFKPDLVKIGYEIKRRIREEIGEYVSCNVGISTNMFLAKLAASLHKPDGLDVIEHHNLLDTYKKVELMDLNGINTRYKTRLNMWGIYSVMDFYNAPKEKLQKQVFKSVLGSRWYEKLRGYETDQKDFETKSIGQQYAIKIATSDENELNRIIMKLCEKMGRRLRKKGLIAKGGHIWCTYKDHTSWHRGRIGEERLYTTSQLYQKIKTILLEEPQRKEVGKIAVCCYGLEPYSSEQIPLFAQDPEKKRLAADACDVINNRYGEFTITPGIMMDMDNIVLDRIAFGGVGDIENLYTA